jgi:hypothetical protein
MMPGDQLRSLVAVFCWEQAGSVCVQKWGTQLLISIIVVSMITGWLAGRLRPDVLSSFSYSNGIEDLPCKNLLQEVILLCPMPSLVLRLFRDKPDIVSLL